MDDSAIERAVALHDARHGMRRPLALLRLARATARSPRPGRHCQPRRRRRCAHWDHRADADIGTAGERPTEPAEPQAHHDRNRQALHAAQTKPS